MCCNDNIVINQIDKPPDSIVINKSNGLNDIVVNINPPSDLKTNSLINFVNLISSNFLKFNNASENIISNSSLYLNLNEVNKLNTITPLTAKWQETAFEVDTMQDSLTANWDETYYDVNFIQSSLSANWQNTYEIVKSGIIDGGFC